MPRDYQIMPRDYQSSVMIEALLAQQATLAFYSVSVLFVKS